MLTSSFRTELRTQIILMLPVLLAQLAQMTLGVVDTVMTGRYGTEDMAAVALGWSVWLPGMLFGIGLIIAVTPSVGQLRGANECSEAIRTVIRQGIWLSLFITVPIVAIMYFLSFRLEWFGLSPQLACLAGKYLRAILWGAPAQFLFVGVRSALEGFAIVRPAMFASFIALAVNIPFNYAFIFGKFGMPELGGVGAGVATAITSWATLLSILMYAKSVPDIRASLIAIGRPYAKHLRRLISIGLPNALASLNEGALFSVVTLLVAPLGTIAVAGHQVATAFSCIIFILPLSVGMAATIRVSHAIGAKNEKGVRLSTRVAFGMGLSLTVFTALTTVFFRYTIAGLFNTEPAVITIAATLLCIDASYQLIDCFQIISVGILRGYKDTRSVFFITTICFWVITVPLAWLIGRTELVLGEQSVQGLWYGLVIGLSLAAVCYFFRIRILEKRLSFSN